MSNSSAWEGTVNSTTVAVPPSIPSSGSHALVYIFIPLGSLLVVVLLAIAVVIVLRRSKMEKLRHHLMPMYSFDPADEDEDWESELLEDQDKVALRIDSPSPTGSTQRYDFTPNRR
ncbi:small integral membrane protein 29-like [Argopecten irradians]|uniref:small integral membrane protein 29-like n=1 Tax=Argopecten irradians TaxID=31199 RepID=UPI003711B9EA